MQRSIIKPRFQKSFALRLNQILEVQNDDPDIRRRSKILNILLLGVQLLVIVAYFVTVILQNKALMPPSETRTLHWSLTVFTGLIWISYIINRRFSEELAASVFLLFLTILFYLSDTPFAAIWGQNLVVLSLPIVMASIILRPNSSFIVATGLNIFFIFIATTSSIRINYVGILAFYCIAFVAWLSSSTLEDALQNLRTLNQELDVRVADRTKELQIANTGLRQARDKAIEASVYKSQLTARASHELRTPLGSIIGFSEMLRSGHFGEVNNKQKDRLTKIIDVTKHLTKLINNWLDQAQLEAGKLKLSSAPFNVRQLSNSVADIMQVLTQEKGLKYYHIVEKNMLTSLCGDEQRVRQIMVNLIGNAIKYTEEGFIQSRIFMPDDLHWAIEIKDSGCGISVDALPFIFDSFHQADGSRTRTHEGFGLGLSIVKQLVQLMNGEIFVDSQVNKGSIFTVVLPKLENPPKK